MYKSQHHILVQTKCKIFAHNMNKYAISFGWSSDNQYLVPATQGYTECSFLTHNVYITQIELELGSLL